MEGRRLDDNAHMMLRFASGAQGHALVQPGGMPAIENGLRIRVYGEKAGLEWHQENPNYLTFSPLGEPPRTDPPQRLRAPTRPPAPPRAFPAGHPEGYLEGFAQLYTDIAEQIAARIENREPNPLLAPGADRRPRRARRALHRSGRALLAAQGRLGRSVGSCCDCESPAPSAGLSRRSLEIASAIMTYRMITLPADF